MFKGTTVDRASRISPVSLLSVTAFCLQSFRSVPLQVSEMVLPRSPTASTSSDLPGQLSVFFFQRRTMVSISVSNTVRKLLWDLRQLKVIIHILFSTSKLEVYEDSNAAF